MAREAKYPVQTTQRTLDIVEELSDLGTAGVTELATELGMNKSIVHNHLRTLEERGYVVTDGDQYRLGLRFFQIGGKTRKEKKLFQIAKDEVDQTATETQMATNLAVEENGKCVYIYRAAGEQAVDLQFAYEGMYEHMHQTAVGKAIMAYLPDERVREIVDQHGLPERTEYTITELDDLLAELERTREQGYAVDDEECVIGLRCVAAPIRADNDEILGSVSVTGPKSRFKDETWEQDLPEKIRDTSNIIELQFAGRA